MASYDMALNAICQDSRPAASVRSTPGAGRTWCSILDVTRDLLFGREPDARPGLHMENQLFQRRGAGTVPGVVRMHRQDKQSSFRPGHVELRLKHLLDQFRRRQRTV